MEIITVGLSPNTQSDDVKQALKVFFMPWCWYKQDARNQVIDWFRKKYHVHVTLFSSGRSALTALLTSFGIGEGDEVILQAFTCLVVPNAIRFTGATPVYVDIDETANIDPVGMEAKITSKTKALIVQHTFGTPADMDVIMNIAKKNNIRVIEDCAHALGAVYRGKKVGTIGDAAIFSFGRDKIISSVFGGAAIINGKCLPAGKAGQMANDKLKQIEKHILQPSYFWIAQQLCHPIASGIIVPLYSSGIGKLLLVILQKLRVLSFPVSKSELAGKKPVNYMMRYPNALAFLLIKQLHKLDAYTKNRQEISEYYEEELKKMYVSYLGCRQQSARLRFSILANNPEHLLTEARKNGIYFGNWYHNVVDPTGYIYGVCPNAERLAKKIINLPTRISKKQADKVLHVLKQYA